MEITTGFLADNLTSGWEEDAIRGYDLDASAAKYAEMLEQAIRAEYPGAEVEVSYQSGAEGILPRPLRTAIDGDRGDERCQDIDIIAENVYNGWEWMVEIDSGEKQE